MMFMLLSELVKYRRTYSVTRLDATEEMEGKYAKADKMA